MAKKKTARASKPATKSKGAIARRAKKTAPASTALMRVHDPNGTLAQALQDQPVLGAFALVELKLTKHEEKVLARPVTMAHVQIKPTGQPYLPHAAYRRWLTDAFGRMGWQLRPTNNPVAAPAKHEKAIQIVRGYLLYVHGNPVAYGDGEHEFWKNNAEQSWGDALEATQASALRRCAKHLNIGLELWDREFLEKFKREVCIVDTVRVRDRQGNTQTKKVWRRRDQDQPANVTDDVIDAEIIEGDGGAPAGRRQAPRAAGSDGNGGMMISAPQSRRLFNLATKDAGRKWPDVLAWLKRAYNAIETGEKPDRYITLPRTDYTAVCEAVMAPGPLPEGRA